MPIYSITDTQTKETVLAEADTAAQAVRLYMGDRLVVSAALDATQAVALATSGTRVIRPPKQDADETPLPFSQTEHAAAFTAGMEDCDQDREKADV